MRYLYFFLVIIVLFQQSIVAQESIVIVPDEITVVDEATGKNGMVITNTPLASQTAMNILKKGGNAVDAAIAANAVLGVTNPTSGGVGGDLYALIWDAKTRQLYGLNASGRSSNLLSFEKLKSLKINTIDENSPYSVTVPGCVDGWNEMHEKFGRLPVYEILLDAIHYAQNGIVITEDVAELLENETIRLNRYENFRKTYLIDSISPVAGQIFRNPDLAYLYKSLVSKGFRSFYNSEISQNISASVTELGGFLSVSDLTMHHSEWVEPISTDYRGNLVYQLPPNSMGINLLEMLEILENFDLVQLNYGSKKYLHTLIEVKKIVYQDQSNFFGDPTYHKYKTDKYLSQEYAKKKLLSFSSGSAVNIPSIQFENERNTLSIIIADNEGNLVVMAQNNYSGMGSGIVPDSLGFVLQNRAAAFSLKKNEGNVYAASSRPFFNALPCIVFKDDRPIIGIGLTNNLLNALTETQLILNTLDFNMEPIEAMQVPYIYHNLFAKPKESGKNIPWTTIEKGINYQVVRELIAAGQRIKFISEPVVGLQALFLLSDKNRYQGLSRSKGNGYIIGY
jgi:gamma-glutamyltranspeptidase/glutathione hydrolase